MGWVPTLDTAPESATQMPDIDNSGTDFFDAVPVASEDHISWWVQVSVNFPTTPTDNAIVKVFVTLDEASEQWDSKNHPYDEAAILNSDDPAVATFKFDAPKFRVSVESTGTTNLLIADMKYREFTT